MKSSVDRAAKALLATLGVPPGSANVLPWADASGRIYMRLFVDTQFWKELRDIPQKFQGFDVVVEKREMTLSH